jgi:hypothetical protein
MKKRQKSRGIMKTLEKSYPQRINRQARSLYNAKRKLQKATQADE